MIHWIGYCRLSGHVWMMNWKDVWYSRSEQLISRPRFKPRPLSLVLQEQRSHDKNKLVFGIRVMSCGDDHRQICGNTMHVFFFNPLTSLPQNAFRAELRSLDMIVFPDVSLFLQPNKKCTVRCAIICLNARYCTSLSKKSKENFPREDVRRRRRLRNIWEQTVNKFKRLANFTNWSQSYEIGRHRFIQILSNSLNII
jgi:hypothetical protein